MPKPKVGQQQQNQHQQKQQHQQQLQQQLPTQNRAPNQQATQQQQSNNNNGKIKMPPINTIDIECKELVSLCKLAIGNNFVVKRLAGNRHAIQTYAVADHDKIKEVLKRATAEFYSFTPKQSKSVTVLLKGVDPEMEPAALLEMLQKLKHEDLEFTAVKPFTTAKARRENRKLPFFLVQLTPNSRIGGLRKITVLDHQIVTWDKLKKGRDILQCVRCQRFGHAAANCEMQRRCVKCGNDHKAEECPLGKERVEDKALLKCAVCRNEGHPANYRGCPKFREIMARSVTRQKNTEPARTTTMPVTSQRSYAQVASGGRIPNQATTLVATNTPTQTETTSQADVLTVLLNLQRQMAHMQNQINEIYSHLPSLNKKSI